jgi:ABC-type uncharacterized transport system substrate-binding protein
MTCLPMSTQAHPHVFVTVDVTVIYELGKPAAVRLEWVYDELFSLLLSTDLGIDLDGDGKLEPQELETLALAVTDWPADYSGDLAVEQDGNPISLGAKFDHHMTYEDGIVKEVHSRPLINTDAASLTVRVYDPFYYVAYELAGPVTIEGRADCEALITAPDLNRAYSLVDELLYGRPASDVGADEEFPEVGIEFAQTIYVTCKN